MSSLKSHRLKKHSLGFTAESQSFGKRIFFFFHLSSIRLHKRKTNIISSFSSCTASLIAVFTLQSVLTDLLCYALNSVQGTFSSDLFGKLNGMRDSYASTHRDLVSAAATQTLTLHDHRDCFKHFKWVESPGAAK